MIDASEFTEIESSSAQQQRQPRKTPNTRKVIVTRSMQFSVAVSLRRDEARSWRLSNCLPVAKLKELPNSGCWMKSPRLRAQHAERVSYVAVSLRRDEARQWHLPHYLPVATLKERPKSVYGLKLPRLRAQHSGACWLRSCLAPPRRGVSVALRWVVGLW